MSTITNYVELQTAVSEYLARDDLTARIPTFIQFAEAKFNRSLFVRQMEGRYTATVNILLTSPEVLSLPSDFQSMRRIRLPGVTGVPTIEYKSPSGLDQYRLAIDNVTSQPEYFTIIGSEIELAPTPNSNFVIDIIYRKNIPPLASNSTNWLLTMAPDLYLYGAMLEAAPYMNEDARIQTWALGFANAMAALNDLSKKSAIYNEGPTRLRFTGPTP